METLEKIAVIAIILVGGGIALLFLPFPLPPLDQGKPEFRVSDFRVTGDSVSMYVENTGSGDAHHVKIEVHGYSEGEWIHLNVFDTSGPSELEAGDKQLAVLSASDPSGYNEYKVAINCDEGVTHELIIGFGS